MFILRQSTAVDVLIGPFVDGSDGATPEEALSPSVQLSKNGQTAATKNDVTTPVHDNAGYYNCEFDATDTGTVGQLVAFVEGSTATHLQVRHEFQIMDTAAFDALFADGAEGPLQATTVGRTLDILATGEVPIDFDTSIGSLAAAQIEAGALNGKGDWNIGKTGYSLTQSFPTNFADLAIVLTTGLVSVGTMDTDVLSAASVSSAAVDKIRDGLLPTQNAAFNNIMFLLVAASDHVTPVTGATGLAVTRSIDGAAFGAGTGTLAEIANGIYQYDASAADMNGGIITFRFVASGGTPGAADDRFLTIVTGGGV